MNRHTEKFLALATFIAGMSYGAYSLENHLQIVTHDNNTTPLANAEQALSEIAPSVSLTDSTGE